MYVTVCVIGIFLSLDITGKYLDRQLFIETHTLNPIVQVRFKPLPNSASATTNVPKFY